MVALGCGGDPCEDAAQAYADCGEGLPDNVNRSGECTDTDECVAECITDAYETCDDLSGLSSRCYRECR